MKIVISFGVKEQPKYGKILSGQAGSGFRLSDSDRGKHRSQNHPEVGHGPRPAQQHRRHEIAKQRRNRHAYVPSLSLLRGEVGFFPPAHLPALPAALRDFIQPLAGGAASVRRLHPHRLARSGLLEVALAGDASLRRILAVYRLPVPLPQILQIVPSGADSRGTRNAGRAGAALCSLIPRRSGYREAAAARRCASADGRTALYGSAGSGRTG